ncbi:HIT family protein [Glaciecola sp. XM2]|uniref:HIT domain-containing protein n=1 Tax=Glaciecola sp. XM2 TaxID=1914931 RepID=UPI001BDE805C|nr:HIT family protein [Glaciecola sp. XM2]MBT1449467.1 HIT family protein [Glaciecola sp. XM2]
MSSPDHGFVLHPCLEADSVFVCRLALCQVRLSLDANYPWLLLIPELSNLKELHHMSHKQQQLLTKESQILATAIENCFEPDKLNIASLGNVVPQLHVHHIARYTSDLAWPAPVWGHSPAGVYNEEVLEKRIEHINQHILETRKGL